ncbi:MAG: hypothetical protein KGJ79_01425 [Alphaproteobacteria bacterium]|nr:hypothetical protein [Alphaproteobacteria bacterium]
MSDDNRPRGREALQCDALRRTKEENERWEREHPNALAKIGKYGAMPALNTDDPAVTARAEELRETKVRQWERDMRSLADAHGGVLPPDPAFKVGDEEPQVRLGKFPAAPLDAAADTETLLNGLIAECRFLVREVAFQSACLTPNPDDRMRFLSAAQNIVITGARVGEAVAKLRKGGVSKVEERRHHMVFEHRQAETSPPPPRGDTP